MPLVCKHCGERTMSLNACVIVGHHCEDQDEALLSQTRSRAPRRECANRPAGNDQMGNCIVIFHLSKEKNDLQPR